MDFVTQHLVAAKNDHDKLIQIIFFVVIVCFWVLGVIVKAVSNKAKKTQYLSEEQNAVIPPSETSQYQTKQKPPVLAQYLKRLKKTYADIIVEKETVNEKSAVKTKLGLKNAGLPELSELSVSMPGIKTGLESISKGVTTPLTYDKKGKIGKKQAAQTTIAESLLKFDNTDDLRKGILYYEILGKPLSLRSQDRFF